MSDQRIQVLLSIKGILMNINFLELSIKNGSILRAFAIIILAFTISCSNGSDADSDEIGSIEGVWTAVSCSDESGTIYYGVGDYSNLKISLTLNKDSTYTWVSEDTKESPKVTVVISGTYIYSDSSKILNVVGKTTAGPYTFGENKFYGVEALSNSKLIISENTRLVGVGKQFFTYKKK